ncbi:MAG: cytochrome c [Gammaproteobacteria bacterium]|nr:cytochrome c [Gammaproteobacteria bacterium]MCY3688198.1 cytochrome c [Gammaproteobacteria bacterium]MYC60129.1 cytochrome c [Gammaproteobacteria bacterium]
MRPRISSTGFSTVSRLCLLLNAAFLAACASPDPLAGLDGQRLFFDNCAECHQVNGRGIPNVYPALDGNETVTGSGADVALVLIIGRGEMPSFRGALSSAEMAAIINYVRNAWNNTGAPISAAEVEAL